MDRELGIRLEVIDRETEAMLAVTGCLPLLDPHAKGAILFDIGGGSSELVRLDRRSRKAAGRAEDHAAGSRCRSASSRWPSAAAACMSRRESYAAMIDEVAAMLAPFAKEHGDNIDGMHLLGHVRHGDDRRRHLPQPAALRPPAGGRALDERRRRDRTVQRLLAMSYEERVNNACIGTERGDLVLAGCAILDAIRNAFPCPRLRIADRGLREGMLVQMMREDGLLRTA